MYKIVCNQKAPHLEMVYVEESLLGITHPSMRHLQSAVMPIYHISTQHSVWITQRPHQLVRGCTFLTMPDIASRIPMMPHALLQKNVSVRQLVISLCSTLFNHAVQRHINRTIKSCAQQGVWVHIPICGLHPFCVWRTVIH